MQFFFKFLNHIYSCLVLSFNRIYLYLVFIFELKFFFDQIDLYSYLVLFLNQIYLYLFFLTKYIRIHIRGSKYYSLTSFRQAGTLKTHMLSHSGMKPHKCGQCEKSFRVAANLKTHILTHTGVKKHSQIFQPSFKS